MIGRLAANASGGHHFRFGKMKRRNKELVDKKADIYRQITSDKEQTLQEMYMRNERPIKWIDDINSMEVKKLNWYLKKLLPIQIP